MATKGIKNIVETSCKRSPPPELIAAMAQAGATVEGSKGMPIVRVDSVDSKAWKLLEEWACSIDDEEKQQ